MKKYLIILVSLTTLYSQHINNETGWEFNSSPLQSFYIFNVLQIDGVVAEGDGWAPSTTIESQCIDNPFSCDILGAFNGDICVGWVYADSEGYTTLPIMGISNANPPNGTEEYCEDGDIPTIKVYDSSSGAILNVTAGESVPGWSENYVHQIQNISFANQGLVNLSTGWNYYQSSNQAFYIFENIIYGDGLESQLDVIGAFKDDLCVGWISMESEDFIAVPVMGFEEDLYPNYMEIGDIPDFRVYDYSENIYYNVQLDNDELPGWSPNGYNVIYGETPAFPDEVSGCTALDACNYNLEANVDDGSCYFCYQDNCEEYPSIYFDCNGNCIADVDCSGICGGDTIEDCSGECGGSSELDECGICDGNNSCLSSILSLGLFDASGSLEVIYDFGGPVAGFQFDITGLALTGSSGGAAGDALMTVSTGNGATVIGFSLTNSEIPAGSGVLTVLAFSGVTDSQTELSLGNFGAITDALGIIYETTASGIIDHGDPDCSGNYYSNAFIDDCGQCVPEGTNPDDCLSSDLGIPEQLYLSQNYPNPFNPISVIDYGVSVAGNVNISLYDLNGRKVKQFINFFHIPGYYSLTISSKDLISSIYILQLTSSNEVQTKKIAVVK